MVPGALAAAALRRLGERLLTSTQILSTRSAGAEVSVTVLNIASRVGRGVALKREVKAGTDSLLWNATNDTGPKVPAGTYLISIKAKAGDGSTSRALAALRLNR